MQSIIVSNRGKADITKRSDFTPMKILLLGDIDYIFVPFWSYYIPAEIYDNWKVVIFHCTELPFGRGGSPLQNLIIRGIKDTKISAIKCVKEIDAGDIYMQRYLHIGTGTADEIYDTANRIIREDMIPYILKTNPEPKPQIGEPVYFEKWKCSKADVIRVIDSEYEWGKK